MNESNFWLNFEQELENRDNIVRTAAEAGVPAMYLDSLNDRCEKVCGLYKKGWGSSLDWYIEIGLVLTKL